MAQTTPLTQITARKGFCKPVIFNLFGSRVIRHGKNNNLCVGPRISELVLVRQGIKTMTATSVFYVESIHDCQMYNAPPPQRPKTAHHYDFLPAWSQICPFANCEIPDTYVKSSAAFSALLTRHRHKNPIQILQVDTLQCPPQLRIKTLEDTSLGLERLPPQHLTLETFFELEVGGRRRI